MVIRGKHKGLITFRKIGPRSSWEALNRKGPIIFVAPSLDSWFQNLGGCLQSWLPAQPDVREALEVRSLVFKSLDRFNSLGDSGLIDPRVDPQEAPRLSHHTPVVVASLHLITVLWAGWKWNLSWALSLPRKPWQHSRIGWNPILLCLAWSQPEH